MATKRFVSKDNLGRVWTRLFGKVLNSKEEIEANKSENMIAGADAVKEVYSSLQEVQNNSFKLEKLCNAQVLTMSQSNIAVSNITDYKFLYFYVNGDANDNADYGSLIIPVALFKNRTTYSCINCFSSTDYYASGRVAYSSDTSIKVSCTLKGWSKLYIHVYGIK